MKKIICAFTCVALSVCMFAGCSKKKMENDMSSVESKVSDITSDVESGVSSIGNELMPSSSKPAK